MNRTDVMNTAADIAIETAITTMLAVKHTVGGEAAIPLTDRKEALRFLVRRAMRKEKTNKTRVIVANSKIGEAVS